MYVDTRRSSPWEQFLPQMLSSVITAKIGANMEEDMRLKSGVESGEYTTTPPTEGAKPDFSAKGKNYWRTPVTVEGLPKGYSVIETKRGGVTTGIQVEKPEKRTKWDWYMEQGVAPFGDNIYPIVDGKVDLQNPVSTKDKLTTHQKEYTQMQKQGFKGTLLDSIMATKTPGQTPEQKLATQKELAIFKSNLDTTGKKKFDVQKQIMEADIRSELINNKDDNNFYESNVQLFNTMNKRNEVVYWDKKEGRFADEQTKIIKLTPAAIQGGWTPEKIQQTANSKGMTIQELLKDIGMIK